MKLLLTLAALLAAAAADSDYSAPAPRAAAVEVRILELASNADDDGDFKYHFVSSDDITRQEESDDGVVSGSYSYISPEGVPVSISYTADESGFRAAGDALPSPVPTEYPTPEVPSTEAAPAVRTVETRYASVRAQEDDDDDDEDEVAAVYTPPVRAAAPAVQYEPVYEWRPVYE